MSRQYITAFVAVAAVPGGGHRVGSAPQVYHDRFHRGAGRMGGAAPA